MLDVQCGFIKLGVDVVHGFEGIIFEYFFPNFVPQIFLRVQLRRVRGEEMQDDIGGDLEFVAVVIAGSVHKKQDEVPGIFLRQGLQKNLKEFRIGAGMIR